MLDLDSLIDGLRRGDPERVALFRDRYGAALERLAAKRMSPGLRVRVAPEDIVQSVYRTFLRRAAQGRFAVDDTEALWALLCAIALTKVREKARFHLRHKRGYDRELAPEAGVPEAPGAADPADDLAFSQLLDALLDNLEPDEQRVVELRLQGLSHAEIAVALGRSERTVRRLITRIRAHWEAELDRGGWRDAAP